MTRAFVLVLIALLAGCGRGLTYRSGAFGYAFQGGTGSGIFVTQDVTWDPTLTIEARVRLDSTPSVSAVLFRATMGSAEVSFEIDSSRQVRLTVPYTANCTGATNVVVSTQTLNVGQNYVLTGTAAESGAIRIYIDGVASGVQLGVPVSSFNCNSTDYRVGMDWVGVLDDLRVSTSPIPRYSGAYTPPTAPLALDATTVALMQFDDRPGIDAVIPSQGQPGVVTSFAGSYITSPFF